MLNRLFIILILFGCTSRNSQVDKTLISNWKSHPIPTNPDTLRSYGFSLIDWKVFIKNNDVRVVRSRPNVNHTELPFKIDAKKDKFDLRGELSTIAVDNGYLVGLFRGEWGGNLYWFSKDRKDYYKISDDEIVQFIKRDHQIYAIQGLAHLELSQGSIINIKNEGGKWIAKEYTKLPDAPNGIGLDGKSNLIVITSKGLLAIDKNANQKVLIGEGIWHNGYYTNSLVVKDNIVYAGMRAGVYKYNLLTGNQEWLLPY